MFVLKLCFVILFMIPVLYLSIRFTSNLADDVLMRRKNAAGRKELPLKEDCLSLLRGRTARERARRLPRSGISLIHSVRMHFLQGSRAEL